MKLNSIKDKIRYSIYNSILFEDYDKIHVLISYSIIRKIHNEIQTPNVESISRMKNRTLDNLQNEIN